MRPAITALQDAYVYLTISCGADVRKLARSYNDALYELRHTAVDPNVLAWLGQVPKTQNVRRLLREEMRAELGVQE